MSDAYSKLPGTGDAYERMCGTTGDAYNRLAGSTGDTWTRLIVSCGIIIDGIKEVINLSGKLFKIINISGRLRR